MTPSSNSRRRHVVGIAGATSAVCILVLWTTPVAHAQGTSNKATSKATDDPPGLVGQCFARDIERVYVPDKGGRFEVVTTTGGFAFVQFPETVVLKRLIFEHDGFNVEQLPHAISISAAKRTRDGHTSNMLMQVKGLNVMVDLRLDKTKGRRATLLDVIPLPAKDFERHKVAEQKRQAKLARERNATIMRNYRKAMARMLLELKELRPAGPRIASLDASGPPRYAPPGEVRAVLTRMFESDDFRYLEVVVDNRTEDAVHFDSAWLSEGKGKGVPIDVQFEKSAATDPGRATIAHVRPQQTARAIAAVPRDMTSGFEGLRMSFYGPPPLPTVVAQRVIETWPRMPEHIAKKRRWAKQVAISVRMLGGGFWTDDAADLGREDGTGLTGFGVRIGKGMHHNFVFEAEAMGGRTGEARFYGADWQGMQGDISRQASFGRVQGSGVIRFGDRYVGSMRMGVGIQGTSFESEFTTNGSTMEGPGADFELDGVWLVGAGFDTRLGEHWTFGAGANFSRTWASSASALEAGVHLGYRWSDSL